MLVVLDILRLDDADFNRDRGALGGAEGRRIGAGLRLDVIIDGGQRNKFIFLIPGLCVGAGDDVGVGHLRDVLQVHREVVGRNFFMRFRIHFIMVGQNVHLNRLRGTGYRLDHDFVMDALKQQRLDLAGKDPLTARHDVDVFRADHDIDVFILFKAEVHALIDLIVKHDAVVFLHDPVDDIRFADKAGDVFVFRFVVDFFRGAYLLDFVILHDDDLIRHRQGFFLIVGNEDKRDADFLLNFFQLVLHFLAQLEIQRA